MTRFELVTSCSQGRRANQAALHPATSFTRIVSAPRLPGQGRVMCRRVRDKPTGFMAKRALEGIGVATSLTSRRRGLETIRLVQRPAQKSVELRFPAPFHDAAVSRHDASQEWQGERLVGCQEGR